MKIGVANKKEIKDFRELDDSEYDEYEKAAKQLGDFISDQELLWIVFRNYYEYENLLEQYLVRHFKRALPQMEELLLSGEINRCILSFLSSVRTFLDHSETNLKKRYGKNSNRVKKFKDACSKAYDNNFSYKFLYHLRNYAQHCGMPVTEIQRDAQVINRQTKEASASLRIFCNRDEILRSYDWKKDVAVELKQQPEDIEISFHMVKMFECLKEINLVIIEDELPTIVKSVEVVENLIAPMKNMLEDMQGTPIIFKKVEVINDRGKAKLTLQSIPVELVELIKSTYLGKTNFNS